jgi:hypothetical protein
MKAKLIKTDKDNYTLFDEKGIPIGNTPNVISNNTFSKLSKQNCDEIFGVIDVEKLAGEITKEYATLTPKAFKRGVVLGFNKAMELNKDKVFTLEDMKRGCSLIFLALGDGGDITTDEVIESVLSTQQPNEIEVEIEMEDDKDTLVDNVEQFLKELGDKPKLDSSGQLILKKI